MKTFTEFSTLVLRRAAAAKAANASLEGDALVEALAAALGAPADRVPRLLEALEIVGDNLENFRLVRVYQGETGPHGSVSRGEFHYALDRVVAPGGGRRERRDDREGGRGRGGDRGGGGGGGGGPGGGRGDRDKPRGLGALMKLAAGEKPESKDDDRPARGEMPRAGIGWQLTSAPREFRGGDDRGRGGPRKGPRPPGRGRPGGGPGGERGDRPRGGRPGGGGPGGPGGDRGPRGPRPEGLGGPGGERAARPPRDPNAPPRPPRDPNAPRRERRPLGPDANGMGPDGKPWDPERKAKRDAERAARPAIAPGSEQAAPVAQVAEAPASATSETGDNK